VVVCRPKKYIFSGIVCANTNLLTRLGKYCEKTCARGSSNFIRRNWVLGLPWDPAFLLEEIKLANSKTAPRPLIPDPPYHLIHLDTDPPAHVGYFRSSLRGASFCAHPSSWCASCKGEAAWSRAYSGRRIGSITGMYLRTVKGGVGYECFGV
jgi:hypothetical protein